ncbi:MAG: competence/damage-inducible protein A [Deltaproteobacteria bacterium]|nr:competence/damage-inducible protein A [Deltaproteobacteria bacterium]
MHRTAGIVIIGNEILSGKVQDANSPFLCTELRALGVEVQKISAIADDPELIAREVREFSERFDLVFTTGGVGPTHDDMTIEGIARGFGTRVVRHPRLQEMIEGYYKGDVKEAHLKMAEVPEGCELIEGEQLWVPVMVYRNVYIFPGIPEILRQKFETIKERFREAPFFLRKVYVMEGESAIAELLHDLLKKFPELMLGSYPVINLSEYKVMLTLESRNEAYLEQALKRLLETLPARSVVRVD